VNEVEGILSTGRQNYILLCLKFTIHDSWIKESRKSWQGHVEINMQIKLLQTSAAGTPDG
jgi:hypothetical protein